MFPCVTFTLEFKWAPVVSEMFRNVPIGTGNFMHDVTYDPIDDKLYWMEWQHAPTSSPCPSVSKIRRADFDGGSSVEYVVSDIGCTYRDAVIAIDIQNRYLFWVAESSGYDELYRSKLDGTNITSIGRGGRTGSGDLSFDPVDRTMYWSHSSPTGIQKVNTEDGTSTYIMGSEMGATGIAVDIEGRQLFLTGTGGDLLKIADLNGGNRRTFLAPTAGFHSAYDPYVYRDYVYWIMAGEVMGISDRRIYKMPISGSEPPAPLDVGTYVSCLHIYDHGLSYTQSPSTSDQPHPTLVQLSTMFTSAKASAYQTDMTSLTSKTTSSVSSTASPGIVEIKTASSASSTASLGIIEIKTTSSAPSTASLGILEISIIAGSVFIACVIIILAIVVAKWRRSNGNSAQNKAGRIQLMNRHIAPASTTTTSAVTDTTVANAAPQHIIRPTVGETNPVNPIFAEYEIERTNLEIGDLLGKGAFGVVHKAYIVNQGRSLVAAKGLKDNATNETGDIFLEEIQLVLDIQEKGKCPNILEILGCVTDSQPHYLITEFMKYGDLLNFLRKCKRQEINDQDDILYRLTDTKELEIARQIANGMDFLSRTKYYHGDLAARNILVGEGTVVKIADFGMARDIYTKGYARISEETKRPAKWVSLETNLEGVCSIRSDVWSFGIVLYEIVTHGEVPYPGMDGVEVVTKLRAGYRMEQPANCHVLVYNVMTSCWSEKPDERPTFKILLGTINKILHILGRHSSTENVHDGYVNSRVANAHHDAGR